MNDQRDPWRALGAVEVPDQWDEIVTRSAPADVGRPADEASVLDLGRAPAGGARGRARVLVAAAAVLLVVGAVAAGVALVGSPDDSRVEPAVATTDWPAKDEPSAIWGHEWQLVDIQAGDATEDQQLHIGDGKPIRLDLRERGRFTITACNRWSGTVPIRGDLFQPDESFATAAGCDDPLEDLVALLLSGPSRIDVRGSQLVLTQIPDPRVDDEAPRAMGPQLRYTFVRPEALTFRQQFWGRAWEVRRVAEGDGPWKAVDGSVGRIDATTVGRVGSPECGDPWSLFDADDLVQQGEWSVWRGSCPYRPPEQMAAKRLVRDVLSTSPDAEVTGSTVVLSSPVGRVEAESVPVSTARQPERFFDDGWVVVAAYDRGERIALPADLVLRTKGATHRAEVDACGGSAGGPATLETDQGETRLQVDRAAANPIADCIGPVASVFGFFDALFAGDPVLQIHGTRATLAVPGKRVVLVQLGPI